MVQPRAYSMRFRAGPNCANFRGLPRLPSNNISFKKMTWISWMACPIAPQMLAYAPIIYGLGIFLPLEKKCLQVMQSTGADGLP